MLVVASHSGFTTGETIYVKGAFYKDGSTNYFGYTRKDDSWVKNGASMLDQRGIKIGEWDGNLLVKSDFTDSGYQGEDGYYFKLGFYYPNSTGGYSSVNWSSNILAINVNAPDAAPTPSLVPTAQPTVTYLSSSKVSASPTLKPIPLSRGTPTISTKSASFDKITDDFKTSTKQASLRTKIEGLKNAKGQEVEVLGATDYNFSFATITTGFLLIWLGIGMFLFRFLRTKQIL